MTFVVGTTLPPKPDDPRAGFSLIDVLVALVLLAVLSGLMAVFIGQFRVIKRLQTDISAQMELDALKTYLEDTIGSAMPRPFVEDRIENRLSFEGTASAVRFVTIARQGVRSFGLKETYISLDGDGALKTLVQHFLPRRLDDAQRAAATTSVDLAGNIAALRFEYLIYDAASNAPLWTDKWVAKPGFPAAVRINLMAERNGKMLRAEGHAVLKLSTGILPVERPEGEL